MNKTKRQFVGFGFGPIQSALFLFEAYQSGNFDRFTIAEVNPVLVDAVRKNGGKYTINIAHMDDIEQVTVEGVTLLNPTVEADRAKLIEAVSEADELATALPSVSFFGTGGDASVASILAQGFARRGQNKPAIVYAAENNNHAAELLLAAVQQQPHVKPDTLKQIDILNTVVGKMSGVITEQTTIDRLKLVTLTPDTPQAVLVEAFNRIQVSKPNLDNFERSIDVFVEKDDLLPFEEAKLYGHNAIHAMIGYLAHEKQLVTMAQVADHPDIVSAAREAFLNECGGALIRKYGSLGDPLFTERGFRAYAEDLLTRMMNPNLDDLVARIVRDPVRKLGYDDRIYGTIRLALTHSIEPSQLARGAAAAVRYLVATHDGASDGLPLPASIEAIDYDSLEKLLYAIWGERADVHASWMIAVTLHAMK